MLDLSRLGLQRLPRLVLDRLPQKEEEEQAVQQQQEQQQELLRPAVLQLEFNLLGRLPGEIGRFSATLTELNCNHCELVELPNGLAGGSAV